MMSYSEIYVLISQYATDILPLFADGWERFPIGIPAAEILERLRQEERFWSRNGETDVSKKLGEAIARIEKESE